MYLHAADVAGTSHSFSQFAFNTVTLHIADGY